MPYPVSIEDRVRYWTDQIEHSRKTVKPLFDACNVLIAQYYNEPSTQREESQGEYSEEEHIRRTKSNIVFGFIDQSISNMVDRAPVFQCHPETREAAEKIDPSDPNGLTRAAGTTKIVNYRYRETNQLRVDERVALNAFLFPYGVAKIGYTADFDQRFQELMQSEVSPDLEFENPEDENLFLQTGQAVRVTEHQDHVAHIQAHMEVLQDIRIGLNADDVEALEAVIKDHISLHKKFQDRSDPDANSNIQRESPYAVSWPPNMFLTDTLSMEGPQDARWIAFEWELPIDEVLYNPNYSNMSDLRGVRWKDAPDRPGNLVNDGFDMVRGWEIWAKNYPVGRNKFRDLLMVVAEDHKKFLRYDEEWPYDRIDDYPAETLTYHTGIKRWFHKPPVLMGGGDTVQALVNEVLDANLSIIRKMKNIWLVDPSSGIDQLRMQQILQSPDGSIVEVPGLMEAKGQAVVPLPFHNVPPEKHQLLNDLQSMFDRALGTPQPISLPQSETATEASIVEKRNTSRENRKSGLLSEFQVRKARKMWQLDAQFQSDKLFPLLPNSDQFLELSADIVKGEYLFTIDVSSHATAVSIERSQGMDLLNLFAGLTPLFQQTFGGPPNIPELARRLLVRGFDEQMVEQILPMLQQLAEQGGAQTPGQLFDQTGAPLQPDAVVQDPGAQAAVRAGRTIDRGIGPAQPDAFNRNLPNPGRQEGEGVTA
jgi:hypothetical protein